MNWRKSIAVALALLLLCLSVASCQKEKTPPSAEPEETETDAPPISAELQTDYTDDADRMAYLRTFEEIFCDLAESPAEDFSFAEADGKLTVTGYTGQDPQVRVPAAVDGKPVVAIGRGVFANNAVITALYLPDSITSIGEEILAGATQLRALHTSVLGTPDMPYLGYLFAPKTNENEPVVITHEKNAVHVPPSLQYLELGTGLSAIPDYALFDCNDLVCISLPTTVKTLGKAAMFQCTSLLAVNLDGLTSIGENALGLCTSLTRVELGTSLTEVGFGAFEGCMKVRRIILPFVGGTPTENNYLGYLFGAKSPDFSAGFYPTYLVEVKLLSATALGDYTFYECDSLLRVELPEGLTAIGVRAFSKCIRLEEISIPNSVTTISANAFVGCKKLKTVGFGENASLASIGLNAFYGCRALTAIQLPRTLTALPASCFADCTSLATVDLGGVTHVGKNAFRNCISLTSLTSAGAVTFEDGNELAQK